LRNLYVTEHKPDSSMQFPYHTSLLARESQVNNPQSAQCKCTQYICIYCRCLLARSANSEGLVPLTFL
jgi:hypothetical protein